MIQSGIFLILGILGLTTLFLAASAVAIALASLLSCLVIPLLVKRFL